MRALHDLVIRNGKIVDGSGKKPFHGDVAVDNGKISCQNARGVARVYRKLNVEPVATPPGQSKVEKTIKTKLYYTTYLRQKERTERAYNTCERIPNKRFGPLEWA